MILRGRKVILRSYEDGFTDDELARIYRWSRDEEVLRWSGGSPTPLTFEEFKERFKRERLRPDPRREIFAIFTPEGELIGRVGCFAIDRKEGQAELGIVIGEKDYWGQGYGSDAVITFLQHIFETEGLQRVYLFTFTHNLRAQRCFAKCGFKRMGVVRRFSVELGEHEGVEMEIRREEFEQLRQQDGTSPLPLATYGRRR